VQFVLIVKIWEMILKFFVSFCWGTNETKQKLYCAPKDWGDEKDDGSDGSQGSDGSSFALFGGGTFVARHGLAIRVHLWFSAQAAAALHAQLAHVAAAAAVWDQTHRRACHDRLVDEALQRRAPPAHAGGQARPRHGHRDFHKSPEIGTGRPNKII
jgi:hypothetical protein